MMESIKEKGSRKEGNKHGRVISEEKSMSRGQTKAWEEQIRHMI